MKSIKIKTIILIQLLGLFIMSLSFSNDYSLNWAKQYGSTGNDTVYRVCAKNDGGYIITGTFTDSISFGTGAYGEISLSTDNSKGWIYIASFDQNGIPQWAKSIKSYDAAITVGIGLSLDNSIALTGYFYNSITFAKGESNEKTLTSFTSGKFTSYVAKFDSSGNFLWAKRFGGNKDDFSLDVKFDQSGDIVVAGEIESTNCLFGEGEPQQTTLVSSGNFDCFLAQYSSDGNFNWVRKMGGTGYDNARALIVLPDGASLVTGWFGSTPISFTSSDSSVVLLNPQGLDDIFIAKYSSAGTLEWAKKTGGTSHDISWDIILTNDNAFYITGSFCSTVVFGQGETNETSLTVKNGSDVFLAKYNLDGTLIWVRHAGNNVQVPVSPGNWTAGFSISLDSNNSAIISGQYTNYLDFEPDSSDPTTIYGYSNADLEGFVAKYASDGTFEWAKSTYGSATDIALDVAVLANQDIITAGVFAGKSTFGKDEINEISFTSKGYQDGFVAKYSPYTPIIVVNNTFDNDSSDSWIYANSIGTFDPASVTSSGNHLGISPNGGAAAYGFWLSPDIIVKNNKLYRVRYTINSSLSDATKVPQFRLRVTQPSNWRSWYTTVDSINDAAPSTQALDYDLIFSPQFKENQDKINVAFELLSFTSQDDVNAWIYLDNLEIEQISAHP